MPRLVTAVIPARYASTRLPGKPLLNETGKYLIQHVYDRVLGSRLITSCLVATDDDQIAKAVRSFGGPVELTRRDHVSGTDRIVEVMERRGGDPDDIVLNVQGDEPELEPAYLDRLVERMLAGSWDCATLAAPFPADCDPNDPNYVKVVRDLRGRALYFSRARVPYPRDESDKARMPAGALLHLGVYAYRLAFLLEFARLKPSSLERIEKLEQLRVLENGYAMAVETVEHASAGVDTPADYEAFVRRWRARGGT